MIKVRKIGSLLLGLYLILIGLSMIFLPEEGTEAAILFLALLLIILGIRGLIFYFTMAKHMVGGKSILYLNMILLDFGLVSGTMVGQSKIYLILYLIVAHAFAGVVGILRSGEERRYGVNSWKYEMIYAIGNLVIVVACLCSIGSTETLVWIYGAGILLGGIGQILKVFRKEEVEYVQ